MSFRHTYITEFLYKATLPEELKKIEETLNIFGVVFWHGHNNMGYFHGIIKDWNGIDVKNEEEKIVKKLKDMGVNIKIVIEE